MKHTMLRTMLAASVAAILAGCGGGSAEDDNVEDGGQISEGVTTGQENAGNAPDNACPSHNPYGIPTISDQVLCWSNYSVGYNYSTMQADWVSYAITKSGVNIYTERTDDFREDTTIPEAARAKLDHYVGSGFDRGHLAPAATVGYDEDTMSMTFLLSNISPQEASFNRGGWAELESLVRDCVNDADELLVITGTLFTSSPMARIQGAGSPAVPDAYYKILVDTGSPLRILAFHVPHESFSGSSVSDFVVSVDELESISGQDFFSGLDDSIEDAVEAQSTDFCNIAPYYQEGSNTGSASSDDSSDSTNTGSEYDYPSDGSNTNTENGAAAGESDSSGAEGGATGANEGAGGTESTENTDDSDANVADSSGDSGSDSPSGSGTDDSGSGSTGGSGTDDSGSGSTGGSGTDDSGSGSTGGSGTDGSGSGSTGGSGGSSGADSSDSTGVDSEYDYATGDSGDTSGGDGSGSSEPEYDYATGDSGDTSSSGGSTGSDTGGSEEEYDYATPDDGSSGVSDGSDNSGSDEGDYDYATPVD